MDGTWKNQHGSIRYTRFNLPVPVSFRVLVEWRKHDWQNDINVVADQVAEILVIPEVKCSLGDLAKISISMETRS